MALKIEVVYNPFCQGASVIIDGIVFDRPGSKLNSSLIGKPISNWLQPQINSYHQWDGFLAELMNEINDDQFELVFSGLADDYATFCSGISCQANHVDALGFSAGRYTCRFEEKFAPEQIISRIKELRAMCPSSLPTQALYIMRDAVDETLNQASPLSIEAIRTIVENYRDFLSELCHNPETRKHGQQPTIREMLHQLDDLY